MPFPWLPAAMIASGVASNLATNVVNARMARDQQKFQERMANTAHQREMVDLRRANINPALRGLSGAETPVGARAEMSDPASGAMSALNVARMQAEIDLINDQALLTRTQAGSIQQEWNAGKFDLIRNQVAQGKLDLRLAEEMLPFLIQQVKAEISLTQSSARAAAAGAALDELARAGALNVSQFEEAIGRAGPAARFLLEVLRAMPGAGRMVPRSGGVAPVPSTVRTPVRGPVFPFPKGGR